MNFKELILRPIPPAPITDVPSESSVYEPPQWSGAKGYTRKIRNYLYIAEMDGNLLIVTAYFNGEFAWRTFISDTDYCTQTSVENPKKSTASVGYITQYSQAYVPINGADEVIDEYIKSMHIYSLPAVWGRWSEGIKCVEAMQKRIRDLKTAERHRKIREATDRCMLEIRPTVKGFTKWAEKQSDKVYIVYKTAEDFGVCTHCLKQIPKGGQKWEHRKEMVCPHCHKKAVLICSGCFRDGGIENRTEALWYIQKTSEGCCMRLFAADYNLCKNTHWGDIDIQITPEFSMGISLSEQGRYFINAAGNVCNSFEWGDFMQTHSPYWCNSRNNPDVNGKVYTGNIRTALDHYEQMRYIPWDKVRKTINKYSPVFVLKRLIECPWIEYLLKMKLDNLVKYCLKSSNYTVNSDQWAHPTQRPKSLAHILGVTRAELNAIAPYDPTYAEFSLYKYLMRRKSGMAEYQQLAPYAKYYRDMVNAMEYQPVSRYIRYINEQAVVYQTHDAGDITAVISDYSDYIRDAVNAEYNMDDTATINPHDLFTAHAEAEIDERLKSYDKQYSKYADELALKTAEVVKIKGITLCGKEYAIAPLMTWGELYNESKYLRHCVATYADRYAKGSCIILGVRNANSPKVPMVTVELSPDLKHIRQARGYKNGTPCEAVKAFIEEWHKQLLAKNIEKAG
ncbi:MAG: PcfJ domain-containing protein [Oscillospiraceae bacterium]|nr:PcfJ domain-containing protein [Oscillospiraceae bacterium]